MKKILKATLLLGCLVSLTLQGCVPESRDVVSTPVFSTKNISQTPAVITKETYAEITQTSTPVASPTPISTTTPIYVAPIIPTLNSADAEQLLHRMLSQNGGCKLPCWWGIYPGETRWADAREVIHSFVKRIEEQTFTEQGADGSMHTINLALVYFLQGVPLPEFSLEKPGYFSIRSVDGIVDSVLAHQDAASRFNLSNLLTDLGQPSEVYINSTDASPTGKVPFTLVVDYSDMGILAFYHDDVSVIEDEVYFCVNGKGPIDLEIWNPSPAKNQKVKEEFITALDYWIFDTGLYPIQDMSNLTVEQFYINFRSNDNEACIVTPSDRWIIKNPFYIPTSTPLPASP